MHHCSLFLFFFISIIMFGFSKKRLFGHPMMECASCFTFSSKKNTSFGCGVWVFLLSFMLLVWGWKVLRFGLNFKGILHFLGRWGYLRNGFRFGIDIGEESSSKISPFQSASSEEEEKEEEEEKDLGLEVSKSGFNYKGLFLILGILSCLRNVFRIGIDCSEVRSSVIAYESYLCQEEEDEDEDEEMDLVELRRSLKMERERANNACSELDKERMAAATATDEAMAMILRLQTEKSEIEIQANQYRRMAEQKQVHDQQVINHLRWLVQKHEEERTVLENDLNSCRRRLNKCLVGEEVEGLAWKDHNEGLECNFGDHDLTEGMISSLDMDLPLY